MKKTDRTVAERIAHVTNTASSVQVPMCRGASKIVIGAGANSDWPYDGDLWKSELGIRQVNMCDDGINGEVEFKDNDGQPSGKKIYRS